MKTTTVDKLIEAVGLAIRAISGDKTMQKKMSAYGFTPQSLQQGNKLLNGVELVSDTREQAQRNTRHLSHQIAQDRQTTRNTFRTHVAIARTAFREEPLLLQDLKVDKMVSGDWAWTKQALNFSEAPGANRPGCSSSGRSPESFQQNQAAVQALLDRKAQRLEGKGKAEDFTPEARPEDPEVRGLVRRVSPTGPHGFQREPAAAGDLRHRGALHSAQAKDRRRVICFRLWSERPAHPFSGTVKRVSLVRVVEALR